MIPLLKCIHPVPLQPGALGPEAEGDGLPRRGRVPEKPPGSCTVLPLGDAPRLHPAWKGHCNRLGWEKNREPEEIWVGKDHGGLQTNPLHTPRSTSESDHVAWGPTTALCVGQQYLSLETALWLCGMEVLLTYTRVHASKHNRSVLFIQCD